MWIDDKRAILYRHVSCSQCPLAPQVLRFSEYQEASRKGAMMTVKRLFGRQLRQVGPTLNVWKTV